MPDEPAAVIPLDDFRKTITGSYEDVRNEFEKHFGPGIENFVLLSYKAYEHIQTMETRTPYELRCAWTYGFLYAALNDLISAFHLQISGFLVPAGNLMRQFGEAVAMALLCSHRSIDVFDRIQKDGSRFPAHDAISLVERERNSRLLGIDVTAWKDLKKINRFYDGLSHGGVYAVSAMEVFSTPGAKSLAGTFDEGKLDFYNREIRLSLTAAMRLLETAQHCETLLNTSKPNEPGPGRSKKKRA